MQVPFVDDPIAAMRTAHRDRAGSPSARIWQVLANTWLKHLDRAAASAVHRLDHQGVPEEFRRASRG